MSENTMIDLSEFEGAWMVNPMSKRRYWQLTASGLRAALEVVEQKKAEALRELEVRTLRAIANNEQIDPHNGTAEGQRAGAWVQLHSRLETQLQETEIADAQIARRTQAAVDVEALVAVLPAGEDAAAWGKLGAPQ